MAPVIASSYHIAFANKLGMHKNKDGLYEPNWTSLLAASKACCERVSFKRMKGCVKGFKCKKAALECTALYACKGEYCSQNRHFTCMHCTIAFSHVY